jgi:hypothetical protein
MKSLLICSTLLTSIVGLAFGQATEARKPLSPPADTSLTIEGKAITIKYSAPSMRGRKIFGGLVPFGKVWRAGANAATTLHTEADLELNGLAIPKGDYTLFILPEENQWTLIVNKQTGQWGLNYDQTRDLGRIKLGLSQVATPLETFKITLPSSGANSGKLEFAWEKIVAAATFSVR